MPDSMDDTSRFIRKMVIQRVRNPKHHDQFVDIAITTGLFVKTGSGATFQRNIYEFEFVQLGDPDDLSDPFDVHNQGDLQAAADAFAASHDEGDDD